MNGLTSRAVTYRIGGLPRADWLKSLMLRGCLVVLATLPLGQNGSAQGQGLSAEEIAAHGAAVDRIAAWRATVEIQDAVDGEVKRRRSGEIATMQNAAVDGAQRYYHFTAPQDIRDTGLLIHEHPAEQDDIWLYLPYLGKSRRIAGSAKKNSFVGTQYSFADLTSFEHRRYQHHIAAEEACDQTQCWVLNSIPKEDSYAREIGYSRLRSWVEKESCRIVKIEYYDAAGALMKTQRLSAFISAPDGKALALERTMLNHRNGQSSLIRFSDTDFEVAFDEDDFSAYRLGER